jgi:hypothetical protein
MTPFWRGIFFLSRCFTVDIRNWMNKLRSMTRHFLSNAYKLEGKFQITTYSFRNISNGRFAKQLKTQYDNTRIY